MELGRTTYKIVGSKQETTTLPHTAFEAVLELSQLFDTGLDKETIAILLELLDAGINPEALATVVRELRREAAEYQAAVERVNASAAAAGGAQAQRSRQ